MARLAWQTRKCIRISVNTFTYDHMLKTMITRKSIGYEQMLNTMITSKHIGHALTRLELDVFSRKDEQLSFTALAQHCPNIEHVKIE